MFLQFDVSTTKGVAGFNGFMGSRSYIEGYSFSEADSEFFAKFDGCPDATKYVHAYRWFIHVAALKGVRGLNLASPAAASAAAPAAVPAAAPAAPAAAPKEKADEEDEDDFDVFGDDSDEDDGPQESRADMLARLKKAAEERTKLKEAKQRTIVAIEVKPWSTEQDLMELWKKITTTIKQDGLKWAEGCALQDVAFGIKKICTTFVMGAKNSSDEIVEAIEALEDEVQSVNVLHMNVL